MKWQRVGACLPVVLMLAAAAAAAAAAVDLSEGNSTNFENIDVLQFNLALSEGLNQEQTNEIPGGVKGKLEWQTERFGRCYGCGFNSKAIDELACVNTVRMTVNVGNSYIRNMTGIFKVNHRLCKDKIKPPLQSSGACGPPCHTLRLLKQESLGCYCDKGTNREYEIPKLTCQNNRNKTVDLALCQSHYYSNKGYYSATSCQSSGLCQQNIRWVAGDWSKCSKSQPLRQWRRVECKAVGNDGVMHRMFDSVCAKGNKPITQQFCPRWAAGRFICNCTTGMAERPLVCYRFKKGGGKRLDDTDCESWHPRPGPYIRDCTQAELAKLNCQKNSSH